MIRSAERYYVTRAYMPDAHEGSVPMAYGPYGYPIFFKELPLSLRMAIRLKHGEIADWWAWWINQMKLAGIDARFDKLHDEFVKRYGLVRDGNRYVYS